MTNKKTSADLPMENKDAILRLLEQGDLSGAEQLLKKTMALEKKGKAIEIAETIGGSRSEDAIALAQASGGKIVLRSDGKIDFPELGIKGMERLSVEGPTDQANGLIQGNHTDKYGNRGIAGISYMNGKRAMEEVGKQGKKLFSVSEVVEKTSAFLATLGKTGAEQTKALQALFGTNFSGYWHPEYKEWMNVSSVSVLGLSEVDENTGDVYSVYLRSDDTDKYWYGQKFHQPFLVCEEC